MGGIMIKSSLMDKKYIKSLSQSTPLKDLQQQQTQLYQIYSHSLEQHQFMLEKIRTKKTYDSPYIIKILDSHTLQSQNLCSVVIKTFILVEKPQNLTDQIQQRITMKMGFSQSEIWTLIYSCTLGALFFIKNKVGLVKLTTNKIYIDRKGNIKINDPEFSQGSSFTDKITQSQFIISLHQIVILLKNIKSTYFCQNLSNLLTNMKSSYTSLSQVQSYIQNNHYFPKSKPSKISLLTSSKQKYLTRSKSKKIRVLSGRKPSHHPNKSISLPQTNTTLLTNSQTITSYNYLNKNKQNTSQNIIKQNLQLFKYKNPSTKLQFNKTDLDLQSHQFPKKALCGQRKKIQSRHKQPLHQTLSYQPFDNRQINKQPPSRFNSSLQISQPSFNSTLVNIIASYAPDQQIPVNELYHTQHQFIIESVNKYQVPTKNK